MQGRSGSEGHASGGLIPSPTIANLLWWLECANVLRDIWRYNDMVLRQWRIVYISSSQAHHVTLQAAKRAVHATKRVCHYAIILGANLHTANAIFG